METTVINGMCRCCASEGAFKDIKRSYQWMGEEEVYGEMLKECFDIDLSATEDSDGSICEVCITQLRNACNFKKQVLQTEDHFKKQLQIKFFKPTVVKVEMQDENNQSDDNISLDDGFSGPEFDMPIKKEGTEDSKPKKRAAAAKASTSRAKKSKANDESADTSTTKRRPGRKSGKTTITLQRGKRKILEKEIIVIRSSEELEKPRAKKISLRLKKVSEIHRHIENVATIMQCSNATPIRRYGSIGYACSFCKEEFPEAADLKSHTLETHNDTNIPDSMKKQTMLTYLVKLDITSLRCRFCNLEWNDLETLVDHLQNVHNKFFHSNIKNHIVPFKFDGGPLNCVVCNNAFNNFKVLLEHMNVHYRNHVCEVCGKGFINRRILQTHMYRHKTGVFHCTFCPKIFDTRVKQKDHERATHVCLNKRSKCGYCGEKFSDYTKKNEHEVKVHGAKPVVLKCFACQKTFDNQRSLTVHTKNYHLMEKRVSKRPAYNSI